MFTFRFCLCYRNFYPYIVHTLCNLELCVTRSEDKRFKNDIKNFISLTVNQIFCHGLACNCCPYDTPVLG